MTKEGEEFAFLKNLQKDKMTASENDRIIRSVGNITNIKSMIESIRSQRRNAESYLVYP